MTVVSTKTASEPVKITDLEDYLFDLRGYLLLENAVDADHIQQLMRRWTHMSRWS